METNERILNLVKERGPILPVQISKEINDNILMTSARLSELLSNKKIKISNTKVGGSPLYFVQGQERKLQEYSENLAAKEKEAYNLLKQNQILNDSRQEPAIRVALRQIKDFAIPLQVNYQNKQEIFWKWYMLDNIEAESILKERLSKKAESPKDKPEAKKEEIQKKEQVQVPEKKEESVKKPILKTETTKKIENSRETITKESKHILNDSFLNTINKFFTKNKMEIIETKEIKKNSEIDFIATLETPIGNVKYFCKTKNKKKINESDLSTSLLQAQSKGLPLLFLTTGKITKKSKENLNTNFKNILYKEI